MKAAILIALLMTASAASTAHADSCAQSETAVRTTASQGKELMAQMDVIRQRHATTQWELSMEVEASLDYGWDPESEDYMDTLKGTLDDLEQQWNGLNAELATVEPVLQADLQAHETACGPAADTAALLRDLGLGGN